MSNEPDVDRPARVVRRALRAGDQDAFAELFRVDADAVFTLAHRLTGSWSAAEDVTSETFLAAWRGRLRIADDDRPLRPWLLGIAAHQSMNARRGARRRLGFLAHRQGPGAGVVEDFADEAASRLDDAAALARAAEAVRLLPAHEATVLGLCVWSGLSYAEAAEALGVPVGTVRSRLSRARTRLRAPTEPGKLPGEPPGDPAAATTARGTHDSRGGQR
ncbi:RNA polymerase sigma factor [Nocardioides sp. SOB77]|uniref:RNA polymerase sigma factor n=1 Tax=Nocardioides oceani TaxID=3058369 RepID=A0ABT8FLJ7_9ACTN|nr:RNA polymerase sigma factor [Nocardioides oceani]MDN4175551.1 RNA polymerase sigma factor [Nocardioides oceani]